MTQTTKFKFLTYWKCRHNPITTSWSVWWISIRCWYRALACLTCVWSSRKKLTREMPERHRAELRLSSQPVVLKQSRKQDQKKKGRRRSLAISNWPAFAFFQIWLNNWYEGDENFRALVFLLHNVFHSHYSTIQLSDFVCYFLLLFILLLYIENYCCFLSDSLLTLFAKSRLPAYPGFQF